jgi:hypothetical protein
VENRKLRVLRVPLTKFANRCYLVAELAVLLLETITRHHQLRNRIDAVDHERYPFYPYPNAIILQTWPSITAGAAPYLPDTSGDSSRSSPRPLKLLSSRLADGLLAVGLEGIVAAEAVDDLLAVLF